MTIRMNAALRRRLAGLALGVLVAFAAPPAAMAQWLPPWRTVVSAGDIAGRLEAQGYVLIAPLQRRPGVYLADVRAGPGGFQRLVIDDRSGEILERFISPPRSFGAEYAVRYDEAEPPAPGVGQLSSGPGIRSAPNGRPAAASDVPTNVRIPSAVSPFGSQLAPLSTKPKPKSAIARKIAPATTAPPVLAPPVLAPPLPPPAPREAVKPDGSAPAAPKPEPKSDSPPGEIENASTTSKPAPEDKPEAPKIEPQAEAQTQPTATVQSPEPPSDSFAAPASSPEAGDKSKVSIVPAALFE
jgi:hypothetical protein